MKRTTRTTPTTKTTLSPTYVDRKYMEGRYSPSNILKDTLDSVEIMSTESAESTVEERLRVLEEGPSGWVSGMPKPWSMRSPVYDKPLPVPSRTPSPMPTPSPVGRREREKNTNSERATKVLFPQDAESYEHNLYISPKTGQLAEAKFSPVKMESPSPIRAASHSPEARLSASPAPPQRSPLETAFKANQLERQQLLKAYHQDTKPRGPSPLSFQLSDASKPLSLMKPIPAEADMAKLMKPSPPPKSISPLQTPKASRPVERPLTPFSFAEMLFSRGASPTGFEKSVKKSPQLSGESVDRRAMEEERRVSPGAHMIDLAERGQSKAMQHKWEARQSKEFFADHQSTLGVKQRRGDKSDWKTFRKYPVDKFFNPKLFDPTWQTKSSKRGDKSDWKVERRYPVDEFFNPKLFDEPQQSKSKDDRQSDEKTERKHPIVEFIGSILFSKSRKPKPSKRGDKSDWKTVREYPVDEFFNPRLFDEPWQQEAKNAKSDERVGRNLLASKSPSPALAEAWKSKPSAMGGGKSDWRPERQHPTNKTLGSRLPAKDLQSTPKKGNKFDWQVQRKFAVDTYFVPGLFDSEKTRHAASSPRKGRKDDWRVSREYAVDTYFTPSLFDEERQARKRNVMKLPKNVLQAVSHSRSRSPTRTVSQSRSRSQTRTASPRVSPASDMSYSEAVFGRYKASTGSTADWPFYEDKTGEYEWEDWEVEQQASIEQTKRHLTPSSPFLDQSKRSRQQSPNYRTSDQAWIWDLIISYGPAAVDHDAMIHETVSSRGGGVPGDLKPMIWISLLGLPIMDALCRLYPDLLSMSGQDNEMIEYDVARAVDDPQEQQVLSNVLHAYALYDPVVGYAPGMLNTAMLLREELTEEQTFAALVRVYFAWDQRRLAVPGVDGLRECLYILDQLVQEQLPELHNHLGKHGISMDMFAAHWFHALYIDEALTHSELFTWFLMDGRKAIYSVALGLLAMNESRLLECQDDPEQVSFILQHDIMNGVQAEVVLDYSLQYYSIEEELLLEKQREFAEMRHYSLHSYADEEFELVKTEAVKIMNSIARLSSRMLTVLSDRTRLVSAGSAGRQEVADLHRLCYEQAYRVHVDDARIIADQYFTAIDPDHLTNEEEEGKEDKEDHQSEHNRIADELVNVKVEYAEALAQIDQLKADLKANERQRRVNM